MNQNFTPINTLNIPSQKNLIKKIIKILINLIFGSLLILLGIFFILTSIYGMRGKFLYTLQLFRPRSYLILHNLVGLIKSYFVSFSEIIIGNLILFSGMRFVCQKKGGFKLLLFVLLILLLNFILAIIYYNILKLE